MMRLALIVIVAALAAACQKTETPAPPPVSPAPVAPATPPAPAEPTEPPAAPEPPGPAAAGGSAADGAVCQSGADCASGICEGKGCGAKDGRCVSGTRMCTMDLAPMCGCDGQTFHASSSCPGRLYAHKGECKVPGQTKQPAKPDKPAAAGPIDACKSDGDCEIYFRTHACVPSDPLAINKARREQARKQHPPRQIDCAMGGPQYQCLARQARERWSTTCKQGSCKLVEHAVKPCDASPIGP